MKQRDKKIQKKSHLRTELRILGFVFVFQAFFSGFLVFAGDLTPKAIIQLTNEEREKSGLKPLTESVTLSKAAELKAKDMIQNDYFAHTSPKGITPWSWMKKAGYNYQFAGENLAINFETASAEHKAWMKSKTHRDNIMNAHYQEIGVAVVEGKIDGKSSLVTVQYFGTPVAVAAKAPEEAPITTEAVPAEVKGVESQVVPIPVADNTNNPQVVSGNDASYAVLERMKQSLSLYQYNWSSSLWLAIIFILFATIVSAPLIVLHEAAKKFWEQYKAGQGVLSQPTS